MANKKRNMVLGDFANLEKKEEPINNNTDSEQSNFSVNSNNESEHVNHSLNNNVNVLSSHINDDISVNPLSEMFEQFKKPRVEDTHTRQTYLIRNDLLEKLDSVSKEKGKGFKTFLINLALERVLDELDK